jgi:NhaA family Na+:H+ antiporter
VQLDRVQAADLTAGVTLGIALGLVVGKAVGIFLFSIVAVRLRLAPMPGEASVAKLLGVSVIGGIGFTVALFIAALAFQEHAQLLVEAKLGILLGSLIAGLAGAAMLRMTAVVTEPAAR